MQVIRLLLKAAAAFFILIPASAFAGQVECADGNSVRTNGDSTLRKFSSVSSKVKIRGTAEPKTQGALVPWTPLGVEITIDVNTLKSDSTTLDDHMYEALKADKYPYIGLSLTKFKFENKSVIAEGTLTIAGVSNPVQLAAIQELNEPKINFKGSYALKMTDFGIQPPALMMGAIKTANQIEIIFNVNCSTTLKEENK